MTGRKGVAEKRREIRKGGTVSTMERTGERKLRRQPMWWRIAGGDAIGRRANTGMPKQGRNGKKKTLGDIEDTPSDSGGTLRSRDKRRQDVKPGPIGIGEIGSRRQ